MTAFRSGSVSPRALAAYLEREVTASDSARIEAALADSAELRRGLRELERIRDALAAPPPELAEVDLVARVRQALERPEPARVRRRPFFGWPLAALAAVAALAVTGLEFLPREAAEFRAKSATSARESPPRWAGVVAYRVDQRGVPERLGERMQPSNGLVFSYTNLGSTPFRYLMIFGVDSKRDVHWYHPAYESADTNPASISIRQGDSSVALAELIQHDLPVGRFELHALFTMQPVHVVEIEALLRQGGSASLGTLPGASTQLLVTEVAP